GVNGFRLTVYKTPCKDFLDRGGNQGFVEDRLEHYMMGEEASVARMEEAMYNLLGPPILVKKKEAIPRRIIPGMQVEQILASMDGPAREKLAAYRFGERQWRIVGLHTPREPDQSAMPSISAKIRSEIAQIAPPGGEMRDELTGPILQILKKYAGVEWKQWEEWPSHQNSAPFPQGILIKGQADPADYQAVKAQLLGHLLINEDEQKATQIVTSFQQAIATSATTPLISAIGPEVFANLFAFTESQPSYRLDLSRPDRIVWRLSLTYTLKPQRNGIEGSYQFPVVIKVISQQGHSRGYVSWSIK
ncbi:hypothetical protein ACFLR2_00565, partial [Chlamydiota bacterium]